MGNCLVHFDHLLPVFTNGIAVVKKKLRYWIFYSTTAYKRFCILERIFEKQYKFVTGNKFSIFFLLRC